MPTQFFTDGNDTHVVNIAGAHQLTFLGGEDTLTVFQGTVQAAMGEDDDVVSIRGGLATVYGEGGADRFEIFVGANIHAGSGNDIFNIRSGSGVQGRGGSGDDRFNFAAAAANVELFGDAGHDSFAGNSFASTGSIHGGDGNDLFTGFRSGVWLYGGDGNDAFRLNAGSNADFIELAGQGRDTIQLMRGSDFTLADNFENVVVGTYAGSDATAATITGNALDNVITGHGNEETMHGLAGNDSLNGKSGNDTLNGGDGNDLLDGGAGNDTLAGGAGNDRLIGRTGDDEMFGGTGDDIYYVDSVEDNFTEYVGEGTDTVRTTVSLILYDAIENAVLEGTGDIYLLGTDAANDISGNSGANSLYGYAGDDVINGNGGDDILVGHLGNDTLSGGAGNDQLYGSAGSDTMSGGEGSDTYFFHSISDSPAGAADVILDFNTSGSDVLDFSGIDANTNIDGDQAFGPGAGLYSAPTAYSLWHTSTNYDGSSTIHGDVNGDAVADFEVIYFGGGWSGTGSFVF